jgi:hypothetical protein
MINFTMKSYGFLMMLALVCFLIGPVQIAGAATKKAPPPPVDTRKLIKSVDVAASSVVIEYMRDKTLHAYKVDSVTSLKVNNVSGTVAQIRPGMVVDSFLERDDQTLDGLSVSGYGTAKKS